MEVRGAEVGVGCGFCVKAEAAGAEGGGGVGFVEGSRVAGDAAGFETDGGGFADVCCTWDDDGCAAPVGCAALCALCVVCLAAASTASFLKVPAAYT